MNIFGLKTLDKISEYLLKTNFSRSRASCRLKGLPNIKVFGCKLTDYATESLPQ